MDLSLRQDGDSAAEVPNLRFKVQQGGGVGRASVWSMLTPVQMKRYVNTSKGSAARL